MTHREAFSTGKPHQSAVAAWARTRLADRGGREFDDRMKQATPPQIGCLFADGVGLGKTWEALAAVALLLDKRASRKRRTRAKRAKGVRRKKRIHHRRRVAHVLILLPPGLVAKWSRELADKQGFPKRLAEWAKRGSRAFIESTLVNYFEIHRRSGLDSLRQRGRIKRGKYVLPAGTYLCNWNVFLGRGGRGRDRVTALKNQQWDVVVVDEAHHKEARKALDKLKHPAYTLLLTATPFQLDMTELHGLTRHLVEGKAPAHKVLKRGVVRVYANAADNAFEGGEPPTSLERRKAEDVLGQLIACSKVGRQRRYYFAIDGDGIQKRVKPPTEIEQEDLSQIFKQGIKAPDLFREWYLQQRLKLARREVDNTPKHVAVELQKLLSVKKPPAPPAPRLDALQAWARTQFVEDLKLTLNDGLPRKLVVFTHLKTNVTDPIKQALEEALHDAHYKVSRSRRWREARKAAPEALARVLAKVKQDVTEEKLHKQLDKFGRNISDSLFLDLFGSKKFARKAKQELLKIVDAVKARPRAKSEEADTELYDAQRRVKTSRDFALLEAVARASVAETFTGDDTRRARASIAEAFRTALAPWILVATNVGSEGIDLQTYSGHLVHFDLEWNPARMEQREGRIDRLGRALKEPARIYYLLVKDTYDERMFHQLIARQRWHGVLLGRKALQLGKENAPEAELLSKKKTETMSLNLDPRIRGKG